MCSIKLLLPFLAPPSLPLAGGGIKKVHNDRNSGKVCVLSPDVFQVCKSGSSWMDLVLHKYDKEN